MCVLTTLARFAHVTLVALTVSTVAAPAQPLPRDVLRQPPTALFRFVAGRCLFDCPL